MKNFHSKLLLLLFVGLESVSFAQMPASFENEPLQGQEGRGGDNLEPLFIQAQVDAVAIVNRIRAARIGSLRIEAPFREWLRGGRLPRLQFYVRAMELVFQEGPCDHVPGDSSEPRGVCYDDSDLEHPKMIISRELNRATTPDQAVVLVIHEAGHFTGETDHLFLSRLGIELLRQSRRRPQVPRVEVPARTDPAPRNSQPSEPTEQRRRGEGSRATGPSSDSSAPTPVSESPSMERFVRSGRIIRSSAERCLSDGRRLQARLFLDTAQKCRSAGYVQCHSQSPVVRHRGAGRRYQCDVQVVVIGMRW